MNDDHKHSGQFNASMPLPGDDGQGRTKKETKSNPAADLIRRKIDAAFAQAPPASEEIKEVSRLSPASAASPHQKFMEELLSSGKSLPEIQTAWHEYYAALPDKAKHEVWQEFYAQHAQNSHYAASTTTIQPRSGEPTKIAVAPLRQQRKRLGTKAIELRKRLATTKAQPAKHSASPLKSLAFGIGVGSIVIIIFLFSFFNERFIAPFIQPSRNVTDIPIIESTAAISSAPQIIIPKINVEIPVIYNVDTISNNAVEDALENGVVHYADTALPGQDGNGVIVGHSSNNIFNPGKYKFAFVLLSRLDDGDTFYLDYGGVRYTYEVYQKEIVSPNDVGVLGDTNKPATFSLITCDPPGTSINRLVVVGQQINPNPTANTASTSGNKLATESAVIPGASPSLWSRLVGDL
jgi:sortase A